MRIFKFGKKNQETKKNFRRLRKKSSCSRHVAQKGARLSAKIDVNVKFGTSIGAAPHLIHVSLPEIGGFMRRKMFGAKKPTKKKSELE